MKSTEQLVAAIRELRFAIDRLSEAEIAEAQPAVSQALASQARALKADIEALIAQLEQAADQFVREREPADQ